MRVFIFLFFGSQFYLGCAASKLKEEVQCQLDSTVWQYVGKDDKTDLITYQKKVDTKTISRPRNEIRFGQDGEITLSEVQPNDLVKKKDGKWSLDGNELKIELADDVVKYEIDTCNEMELKIKKI